MRVSARSDYGLRAVLDLAAMYGHGPIQSSEIASRQGIPESYLEQILTVLRKAGLVSSVRGPQGGHSLARHPSRITARDVVEALEGPLLAEENGTGADVASDSCRAVRDMWADVRAAMESVLGRLTIEDLSERNMASAGKAMYNI